MTPRLLCRTGEFAGITRDINADATLGRGSDNDIVVKSPMVSTSHARIYREEEDFFLEDLGSANGTRLDGMEVRGRMRLERLHVITLAETVDLIFTLSDSAPSAADRDRATAATRAPTSSGDEPMPPGRKTEMADASAWADLPDLESPAASRESAESEPSKPQPPSAEPPGRKTEMADSSAWSDLPDLDAPAAKREPPKPQSGKGEQSEPEPAKGEPPPGRKTEMADSSAWSDLPDLDAPPAKREPSKPEPSKSEESGAEPPPGRKTEMADTSGWSDLPDLDAPPSKRESSEPEPSEPEPSEPEPSEPEPSETEPPPGRKTEMADASAWADVPDLAPVEEAEEEPEEEVPFEHRATVVGESLDLPPEDAGGDLGATVQMDQPGPEPAPLPELAVAVPGRPLKTYALKEGDNVIGRSDDCDITVIDPEKQVSRNHAVLRVSRDAITLIDSGSANGTFIDGERVDQAQLSAGKSFRLGPDLECTLLQR